MGKEKTQINSVAVFGAEFKTKARISQSLNEKWGKYLFLGDKLCFKQVQAAAGERWNTGLAVVFSKIQLMALDSRFFEILCMEGKVVFSV